MSDQALANVPEDELTAFRENLDEETKELAARLADQAVGANKVPEEITPEKEPLVIDFITQSEKLLREAENVRVEKRDPHKNRVDAVQARFQSIREVLAAPLAVVKRRHDAYKKAREDEERKRREETARAARAAEEKIRREAEAKQRAAEAEARKAKSEEERRQAAANLQRAQEQTAKADEAAQEAQEAERAKTASYAVEGDLGTKAFSTGSWKPVNIDMAKVDLEALRPHLKEEHVLQAARAWVKAQGNLIEANAEKLKGVEIRHERSTRYRS